MTKSLGLCLGGGGARGLAHIHVLQALDDLGVKPVAISGTSIGSIIGAAYCAGMSGEEISDFVVNTFSDTTAVIGRFWSMRPNSITDLMSGPRTMLGNIDSKKVIEAFNAPKVPKTFEELEIPLQVVATNFYGQDQFIFSSGDLNEALAASAALPAVFRPVKREGKALIDGGIANAVPYELLKGKADITVAVDVVGGPKKSKSEIPTRIEALAGASQLMMQMATRLKCETNPPDVMIVPPVSGIAVLDFMRSKAIIEATKETRETAKRAISQALEGA